MKKRLNVTAVIPAKNEEATIGKMVRIILSVYPKYIGHVIVVNDGSTDATANQVRKIMRDDKRIILVNRSFPQGVGFALREGIKKVPAETTHILTLDADFVRNIPDLEEFFDQIDRFDGLIGSRYMEKYSLIRYPRLKKLFNRLFHLLTKYLYGVQSTDLTNNFKLYKKEVFDALPLTASDYAINAETGLYPILLGYRIGELPVAWYARGRNMGVSKFHLLKVAPGYINVLIRAAKLATKPSTPLFKLFQKLEAYMGKKPD